MIARISLAGAIGSAIAFGALIAGCSSGGSGSTAPQMPTAAATALSTGSSGSLSSAQTAAVNVSIPITQKSATASSRRNPAFVSPGADYVAFTAQPGSVYVGEVQCTQSVCTGTLQVPVATTSITAKITNSGSVLLAIATQAVTINAGQANTVNFVFNGVVTHFQVSLPASQQFVIAAPTSVPATVTAYDASGDQITTAGNLIDANQNVLVSADGSTQTMSLTSSTSHVSISNLAWSSSAYTLTGTATYDGVDPGTGTVTLTPVTTVGDSFFTSAASVAVSPKELLVVATSGYSIPLLDGFPAYQVFAPTSAQPTHTTVEFGTPPTPSPVLVSLTVTANFNNAGVPLALSADSCSNHPTGGTYNDLHAAFPSPVPSSPPVAQATMPASGSYPFTLNVSAALGAGPCGFNITDTTNNLTANTSLDFDTTTLNVQGKARSK
jgi:hypothetical protein